MNSTLISYTKHSPNNSGIRTHEVDRITPHCVVGQLSAEGICRLFSYSASKASCNYAIGYDGAIALCVDEDKRSWCTSSRDNDQRAVTIECASEKADPYEMTDDVYESLVNLCVDICRRNGKNKFIWLADKDKTLSYKPQPDEMVITVHRWFKNKACPGAWLYSRLDQLAKSVTEKLGEAEEVITSDDDENSLTVRVDIDNLNIRTGPGVEYEKTGRHTGKGVFTIVEVKDGWGRLKSGAGWISMGYVTKV